MYPSDEMNEQTRKLFELMYTREFDMDLLRRELDSGKYDADCVNLAALVYVDECCGSRCENDYDDYERRFGETVPGYENSHLVDAIELLLRYGLDPNRVFHETDQKGNNVEDLNIMHQLYFVNNGYQAADALHLLLSHGGDPNLLFRHYPIMEEILLSVEFELQERSDPDEYIDDFAFDALVHYWLVLAGFGALMASGNSPFDPVKGFDISRLKNHRDFYCGMIYTKESHDGWQFCVFNKHSSREVARF